MLAFAGPRGLSSEGLGSLLCYSHNPCLTAVCEIMLQVPLREWGSLGFDVSKQECLLYLKTSLIPNLSSSESLHDVVSWQASVPQKTPLRPSTPPGMEKPPHRISTKSTEGSACLSGTRANAFQLGLKPGGVKAEAGKAHRMWNKNGTRILLKISIIVYPGFRSFSEAKNTQIFLGDNSLPRWCNLGRSVCNSRVWPIRALDSWTTKSPWAGHMTLNGQRL